MCEACAESFSTQIRSTVCMFTLPKKQMAPIRISHRFGSYRSLRKGTASACLFTFTADAQLLCSEVRDCSEKTYESHIGFNNSIGQLEKKPLKSSAPIKTSSTESLKEVQLSTGNDLWRHRLFDPPQFPGVQHLNPHAAPA